MTASSPPEPAVVPLPESALLADILDGMSARICVVGRDFRYRYVNRDFCAFAARPPEAILGRTTRELVGDAVADTLDPSAHAALAGETVRREGWIEYRVGGRRYIAWVFSPLRLADGSVDGFVVFMRDLTELKQREEEVAIRTAQLEAILEGVADGISILGPDGVLRLCNRGFLRIFGYPEAMGRPGTTRAEFAAVRLRHGHLYAHEVPGMTPAAMDAAQRARLTNAIGPLREEMQLGSRRLRIRRQVLPDGSVVSTYIDVTAERDAARARAASHAVLREAQQLGTMATLLAGIGHELNNPLAVVAAQASVLAEEAAGTPFATRASKISLAARRCGRLVESLLAAARRRPPQREPVAVAHAVAAAADLLGDRLGAAGIELDCAVPAELPPVRADCDQLTHLVANLLGNAVDVLAGRPPPRRIELTARVVGRSIELRCTDNGPGIPAALRDRVFDPFFSLKPDGLGTGIGLALCRTIAIDHGGRIEARDGAEGGAMLVVHLPLA